MTETITDVTAGGKPRYELLDGLRGVAAILVICYHFCEAFATSPVDMNINHGYLAVDFFFVLSGFVIGYAYDGRWGKGLTRRGFMLRRVIRLHPMVILAVVLGAAAFLIQGSVKWDGTAVELPSVALALLLGLLLIPVLPGSGAEVRGNGEMFPLNGPSWSLFFEYIGSILYAILLCRMSTRQLRWFVAASAAGLIATTLADISGAYNIGVGWTMANYGFFGGLLRMLFSFSAGLLMCRTFRPRKIRGAFWICTATLCAVFACPYVGSSTEPSVLNAVYDLTAAIIVLPAMVWIGACGITTDRLSTAVCGFMGAISYPVYIIHYPAMYLFYSWVWGNGLGIEEVWPTCIGIFVGIITLAWLAMKYYDIPVRRRLTAGFIKR